MAQRYFIQLSYDGTAFHGWQIQPNAKTIQETLNEVLSRWCKTEIYTVGCGRTDTGVHAKKFYAHFEVQGTIEDLIDMAYHVNQMLPSSIALQRIFPVNESCHARFSATGRSYEYHITQHKDPFAVNRSWEFREELDLAKMNEAAAALLAYDDFSSFSKSNTQTETNLCDVTYAKWVADGHSLVFHITANRFLRNMVRAVVGTLVEIGKGKIDLERFHEIVTLKNRSEAGTSVPAHGLYLTDIIYPKEYGIE